MEVDEKAFDIEFSPEDKLKLQDAVANKLKNLSSFSDDVLPVGE
jgi:hypothetical protein